MGGIKLYSCCKWTTFRRATDLAKCFYMLIHANFGALLVPLLWVPFQKLKRTSKVQSKLESKVTLLDPSFAILFTFLWHFFCAVSVPIVLYYEYCFGVQRALCNPKKYVQNEANSEQESKVARVWRLWRSTENETGRYSSRKYMGRRKGLEVGVQKIKIGYKWEIRS